LFIADEQARQNSLSSAEVTGSEGEAINAPQSSQQYGLITLKLSLNLFEGATGCHEWEAGFLLAEFVLSHPDVFKGGLQASAIFVQFASCKPHWVQEFSPTGCCHIGMCFLNAVN